MNIWKPKRCLASPDRRKFEETSVAVLNKLNTQHLPQALTLSSALGWPYRLEDWAFAHRLGEGLALQQDDRLVGTAMRWDYGDAFASVGMIIVAQASRGHGYGARLFDALLDSAGARSIFLNSTAEALELYRRRGFVPTGTLNQHQGVFLSAGEQSGVAESGDCRVGSASGSDLTEIIRLDEAALGMPRPELLMSIAEVGRFYVLSRGGSVTGYAACRAFGKGHVIGPVIAPDVDTARVLIDSILSQLPTGFVRVDTRADSGLSPWLESRGLPRVDTATPMIRGASPPASEGARVFALCSQSLG